MKITDYLNKDNLATGWKNFSDVAGKAAKQGIAGGKFVGQKAAQGAEALKENIQEDVRQRKQTKRIQEDGEKLLAEYQFRLAVSQKMLEEEASSFNDAIEQLERSQLYVYLRFCEYMQRDYHRGLQKSQAADVAFPEEMHLWQDAGYAAGAVAAGTATGAATLGLVTAFGTASTGTALATLSGPAYVHATLAALGGGSLATGGLGMAGGAAVLGAVVAAPMLAVASFAADRKIRSDYEEALRWQSEVIRYSEEVQDACRRNNQQRQTLRALNQDMYAFGLFFQDMLNAGLGAAACDEADAYMPLLNDAATTLIAYSQLAAAPAEQDRGALQDVEAKRDRLHEVEHRCKAEFYRYYASLELPKQELLEQARERDALAVADRLVEAISELRDLFEQGIYEVNQKVDDLHEDMTERFDAVDDALADVEGVLENMTGDIRRLQQRRNRIWRFLD